MNVFDIMSSYEQGLKEGKEQLQQENTQLKTELQAVRELLKETYSEWNHCHVCNHISEYDGKPHDEDCWLKAQIDKLPPNPKEEV